MNTHTHSRTHLAAAFCALVLLAGSASAVPILTYSFFQGGYADGAFVSGSFLVYDLNGDGEFTPGSIPFQPEALSYNAVFSGSSTIPAFGAVDDGLGVFGFRYNPATNDIFMIAVPFSFDSRFLGTQISIQQAPAPVPARSFTTIS